MKKPKKAAKPVPRGRRTFTKLIPGCACQSGMSTDIRKAYDLAYTMFNALPATDKRFERTVILRGEDGLEMKIPNAFYVTDEVVCAGPNSCGGRGVAHSHLYVMVITEHYGVMVFDEDDLETYSQAVPPAFAPKERRKKRS